MFSLNFKKNTNLDNPINFLRSLLSLLRSEYHHFRAYFLKRNVEIHKQKIRSASDVFNSYPEIGFVFQFHNKQKNVGRVLSPFLKELEPKNIVFFADGCVDKTAAEASKLLYGFNHIVISRNDTHEIENYNFANNILSSWGCKYAVYLQDDDIYSGSIRKWLDRTLGLLDEDDRIAIIGLNGGADLTSAAPRQADKEFCSALFQSVDIEDDTKINRKLNRLGNYYETFSVDIAPTEDASNYVFCATVNRAPQIVRIKHAIDLGFFPPQMQPYQYDDYYNCFKSWLSGYKCVLAPINTKAGNIGIGGMRLFNNVTCSNRPDHFIENFNFVLQEFGDEWNSGQIQQLVDAANSELQQK